MAFASAGKSGSGTTPNLQFGQTSTGDLASRIADLKSRMTLAPNALTDMKGSIGAILARSPLAQQAQTLDFAPTPITQASVGPFQPGAIDQRNAAIVAKQKALAAAKVTQDQIDQLRNFADPSLPGLGHAGGTTPSGTTNDPTDPLVQLSDGTQLPLSKLKSTYSNVGMSSDGSTPGYWIPQGGDNTNPGNFLTAQYVV